MIPKMYLNIMNDSLTTFESMPDFFKNTHIIYTSKKKIPIRHVCWVVQQNVNFFHCASCSDTQCWFQSRDEAAALKINTFYNYDKLIDYKSLKRCKIEAHFCKSKIN